MHIFEDESFCGLLMTYFNAKEVNATARTSKMFNRVSWKKKTYRFSSRFVQLVLSLSDEFLVVDCRQLALKNVPWDIIHPRRGQFFSENVIEGLVVSGIHVDLLDFPLELNNIKAIVCTPDNFHLEYENMPVRFGHVSNVPPNVCKTMKSLTVQRVPHFDNDILPQLSVISADVTLNLPRPFQVPALVHVCLNSCMDLNLSMLNQYPTVKTVWVKSASDLWRLQVSTELTYVENLCFLFWNRSFYATQELAQVLVDFAPNLKTLVLQADTKAELFTPANIDVQFQQFQLF